MLTVIISESGFDDKLMPSQKNDVNKRHLYTIDDIFNQFYHQNIITSKFMENS